MAIEQQMTLSEQLLECRSKIAQMAVQLKEARIEIELKGEKVVHQYRRAERWRVRTEEAETKIEQLQVELHGWESDNVRILADRTKKAEAENHSLQERVKVLKEALKWYRLEFKCDALGAIARQALQ